ASGTIVSGYLVCERHRPAVWTLAEGADAFRNARAMIDIVDLVKRFPGAARAAVDRLTLLIPEGEVCVLIGPSGCGKTTTMRIINRMIEPDSGTVRIGGRNVMDTDQVSLRRSIGYVL